jgi:acyl-CoA synthetase (AMP-forming)/AMP-acid ligase II
VVLRSPMPEVEIPEAPLTTVVLERADELADKPALIEGPSGRALTYCQLSDAIGRVAGGFSARGLHKGDVVGMFAPNVPEYAVAFHGAASAGGVVTTANTLYTADELAFQLQDAGARYLVTIPQFLERAGEAARKAGVEEIFVLGDAPGGADGATPFTALLAAGTDPPAVDIDPHEDLVALPYSSGTTGLPKGVMLTHHNLVANVAQIGPCMNIAESDVVIGVLPFFHIYGMTVIMNSVLRRGATVVTMPRFELEPFLRLLQDHAITRAFVVPPIVLALAKHPLVDRYDLSALRVMCSGAAPLGPDLQQACADRLGCQVLQGYGMTEASPVTHAVPATPGPATPGQVKLGSIGPLISNTDGRVVEPGSGADLDVGHTGEIWVGGPQVMKGYLHNPDATAATVDAEGWLRTGDLGYADDDGYFYVVDRLKELIKYKGFQVPPAELEAVLLTHAAVTDVAVIPCPDEEAGEVPKAFVVLRGEVSPKVTPEELIAFVAERVAPHKRIRAVEVVEQIPKSPSGKILRRVLIEAERRRVSSGGDPAPASGAQ